VPLKSKQSWLKAGKGKNSFIQTMNDCYWMGTNDLIDEK